MAIEGHRTYGHPQSGTPKLSIEDESLVAAVNAVKLPDGQHRRPQICRDVLDATPHRAGRQTAAGNDCCGLPHIAVLADVLYSSSCGLAYAFTTVHVHCECSDSGRTLHRCRTIRAAETSVSEQLSAAPTVRAYRCASARAAGIGDYATVESDSTNSLRLATILTAAQPSVQQISWMQYIDATDTVVG